MGLFLLDNLNTRTTRPIQLPFEYVFGQLPNTLENLVGNAFSDVLQEEDLDDLFNNDDSIIPPDPVPHQQHRKVHSTPIAQQ